MPRPRGPHGKEVSTPICVRLPNDVATALFNAAGATGGSQLAEYHRNLIRRQLKIPLDYKAGYEEGKAQGWTEASERLREALKGS